MKDKSDNTKEGYREKIIEMVRKIDNEEYLFKIYHYILPKFDKTNKEAGNN